LEAVLVVPALVHLVPAIDAAMDWPGNKVTRSKANIEARAILRI